MTNTTKHTQADPYVDLKLSARHRKAGHTPGPWSRNIKADGKYPIIFVGRNTHVAQALGHNSLSPDEIEANISLIATAPKLLEELKRGLEDIQSFREDLDNREYLNILERLDKQEEAYKQAIALAEGRDPK
jgi:hypothetical protein